MAPPLARSPPSWRRSRPSRRPAPPPPPPPPLAQPGSISPSLADPLTLENGFPTSATAITNTYAVNPNYKLGYAQTWSFAIQQTLPQNTLVELEYIGTKGTGLSV